MGWLITLVAIVVLLAMWVTWTATRLDRLHARVEGARVSLDGQLHRRTTAAAALGEDPPDWTDPDTSARLRDLAAASSAAPAERREEAENALGKGIVDVLRSRPESDAAAEPPVAELVEACTRVRLARRFYNDAVRDTRSLRAKRIPRLLRLAGRAPLPAYFEIDDELPG